MSKTLKTFDDGSELNTANLPAFLAVIILTGAAGGYAAIKWDEFKTRRIMRASNRRTRR